mgnify:CR=1 FL=1
MRNNVAIIIPARLASQRLPDKPLVNICGKSMIQRVYEKAAKTGIKDIFIACDGQKIANEVKKFGGNYIITDPDLPSGTDRIYAAYQEISKNGKNFDYIINLQGDLPNVDHEVINAAIEAISKNDCDIATLASKIESVREVKDPNIVKIAIAFKEKKYGQALYFSRSPIPFYRDEQENILKDQQYYHHIGIYAYTKKALIKFVSLKQSNLEKIESLEQLRALENDMKIVVNIVNSNPLSVDTKNDLEIITKIITNEES